MHEKIINNEINDENDSQYVIPLKASVIEKDSLYEKESEAECPLIKKRNQEEEEKVRTEPKFRYNEDQKHSQCPGFSNWFG